MKARDPSKRQRPGKGGPPNGDIPVNSGQGDVNSVKGKIHYDTGFLAVAFAIRAANQRHASDGGRTFLDFWTGEGSRGFWRSATAYEGVVFASCTVREVQGIIRETPTSRVDGSGQNPTPHYCNRSSKH